jgi:hypothetical protein
MADMNVYSPGDIYAPVERAQEYQAKQNSLAAARQQEMQANMLRNVVSQNIDPRTGRTNWQGAMSAAPQRLLPQLQGMMGESEKAAAELAAKQATTRKTEMEGDASYWQNQRNLASLPHTQKSWSAWRETLPEWSREYVPEEFTLASQQQVMRDSAAAIAEFNRQNLTANEQSMETDRAAGRRTSEGQLRVAERNAAVNEAAESRAQAAYGSSIDPETQRRLAEAKKRGEEAAGKGPAATSAAAAQAFLTSAGYNPETGADEVSKLIPKSTGGAIQTGLAKTAGAFNITTSGQEAIGQLASRSSKLVLDLLGGKLGAGVSNADREFMLQAVGDIGNSMLPTGTRLAAWNDLMNRMKTAADGGAAPSALPSPSAAAIQHLLSNPNLAAAFDKKYGAGAAATYSAKGK